MTALLLAAGGLVTALTPSPSTSLHIADRSAVAGDAQANDFGTPFYLLRPSQMSVAEFEQLLFPFLKSRKYVELGWAVDKGVRDTGPFIDGIYYGTHPAVRVYYSPGVMQWLVSGRQGAIPDGEMIIKEQYPAPAARHAGKSESELRESLESWTVMVKDSRGSHDGWFWSNPGADAEVVDFHADNSYPLSGFGLYCIRCHAATQSPGTEGPDSPDNEFTFASLRNIEGHAGQPIQFRVDDSWLGDTPAGAESTAPQSDSESVQEPTNELARWYPQISRRALNELQWFPNESFDSVPAHRELKPGLLTADQCMSCHGGLTGPFGPTGFVHTGESKGYGEPGINVSPYGEWRWTPMGLAGRDPVFHAQLESELAMNRAQIGDDESSRELSDTLVDTCLRCHGAMGHRAWHHDRDDGKLMGSELLTKTAAVGADPGSSDEGFHAHVAALARDGVSCMMCHRQQPRPQPTDDKRPYLEYFLETSSTGRVFFGPEGEIYGPRKDDEIQSYAMHHGIGWEPKHGEFISQSQVCGGCHTVVLPAIDSPVDGRSGLSDVEQQLRDAVSVAAFKDFHHHVEQATYLEWLNSKFDNEINPDNPHGQSCQDCHMQRETFADETGDLAGTIQTRIAAIQDTTYPDAENLADHAELNIRLRDGVRRHHFAGLNIWLLELFKQFDHQLGVRRSDYMTGVDSGADQAIQNMVRMASQDTAQVSVSATSSSDRILESRVRVTNLAGHRFPTGVGFRRAFLELLVLESGKNGEPDRVLWSSGRTNGAGILLGADGQPLPSEFFDSDPAGGQHFQPHHEVIESPDHVQIYETLLHDHAGRFTTSFVRGCEVVKDNRLLPEGWSREGPGGGLTGAWLSATHPDPETMKDPDFVNGQGSDVTVYRATLPPGVDLARVRVRATLYYQSLPPYYLRNLFETAPEGPATQRLHVLVTRMNLEGTAIENWKLRIGSDESAILRELGSAGTSDSKSTTDFKEKP